MIISILIIKNDNIKYRCLTDCPDLVKEFYIEDPEVTMMSPDEANRIRKENKILAVKDLSEGDNKRTIPNPCVTFEHAFKHYRKYLGEILCSSNANTVLCHIIMKHCNDINSQVFPLNWLCSLIEHY